MAWNKLSVFHWHIIEIDSFPLELDSFPQLAQNAAFARNQVYTKAQVADIVRIHSCCTVLSRSRVVSFQTLTLACVRALILALSFQVNYGREMGVRVMPEVEMPGCVASALVTSSTPGCGSCEGRLIS
jgi:N-acetyl-beta-hexosaminidase